MRRTEKFYPWVREGSYRGGCQVWFSDRFFSGLSSCFKEIYKSGVRPGLDGAVVGFFSTLLVNFQGDIRVMLIMLAVLVLVLVVILSFLPVGVSRFVF